MQGMQADTVVVGTGPGGATIARELARAGEDVLILEKGRDHQFPIGSILAYATMYDIRKSKEGVLVRRGITTGGSTMIYSGNSYDPPAFLKKELKINLSKEVKETKKELKIQPIPRNYYENWTGTKRLVAAAEELGYSMEPQERFIDPDLCDPSCDRCLFGCSRGAKWTSREYVYDALVHGAKIITQCDVQKVITSGGEVSGVVAQTPQGTLVVNTGRVILGAGGLGTPMILQRSGIKGAGTHFFTDPMSVMVGLSSDSTGTWHEITYTFADESHVGEFVMGNVGAVNAFMAQIAALHLPYARRIAQLPKMVGMFVKLCDEPTGSIEPDGTLHKAFTAKDEETMAKGVAAAKSIMIKAGVIPETISVAKGIGGHPGGTAAIGRVVGTDLMTEIKNLYVCDNSVMPHSGGIPPVLTLIALGKKFARSLQKKPSA
ncbi:MAG TPA: FAD-dependent oxidoreductase [Deltaproteobacteria bacterium]|nr:FAD-dependent oxidoreductase [Deltaproteobacteria bacterium]